MKARKGSRQGGISNLSLGNLSLGFDQQIGFLWRWCRNEDALVHICLLAGGTLPITEVYVVLLDWSSSAGQPITIIRIYLWINSIPSSWCHFLVGLGCTHSRSASPLQTWNLEHPVQVPFSTRVNSIRNNSTFHQFVTFYRHWAVTTRTRHTDTKHFWHLEI